MPIAAAVRIASLLLLLVAGAVYPQAAHAEEWMRSPPAPLAQEQSMYEGDAGPVEPCSGFAARSRKSLPFTKSGKKIVKEDNAKRNEGQTRCENCDVETVAPKQHQKGVTPPGNETHVDHVIPRVEGGRGDPDNGQVLCRDCNLQKGAKTPETPRKTPAP